MNKLLLALILAAATATSAKAETLYRQVVLYHGNVVAVGPEHSLTQCESALEQLRTTTHSSYELKCLPSDEVPKW